MLFGFSQRVKESFSENKIRFTQFLPLITCLYSYSHVSRLWKLLGQQHINSLELLRPNFILIAILWNCDDNKLFYLNHENCDDNKLWEKVGVTRSPVTIVTAQLSMAHTLIARSIWIVIHLQKHHPPHHHPHRNHHQQHIYLDSRPSSLNVKQVLQCCSFQKQTAPVR